MEVVPTKEKSVKCTDLALVEQRLSHGPEKWVVKRQMNYIGIGSQGTNTGTGTHI